MTQDQDNIITMFETTILFLDNNNAVWSGMPAFADAVTRAKAGMVDIDTSADKQVTPLKGLALDKASVRATLEEQTLEIADQLAALAAKNGDHDLAAKVLATKSSLDTMPDTDLEQFSERVAGLANDNKPALAAYNVVPADITALDAARSAFSGKKTTPREAAAERKAQTQSLAQLIASVRSIFRNELDKMATKFRKTNTDFYNGYFAARVIVNLAATHAPPKKPATP